MKGFGPFLTGVIVGGLAVFASLSYHFIRTKDGVEVVPKLSPVFTETYVDARTFTPSQWAEKKSLVAAITRANKLEKIVGGQVGDQMQQAVQGFVDQLGSAPGGQQR
ncbi:MAG: hypothetical protein QM775_26125 [Pirellulales bacterium]